MMKLKSKLTLCSHNTVILSELVLKQKRVHGVPKHQENERLGQQLVLHVLPVCSPDTGTSHHVHLSGGCRASAEFVLHSGVRFVL